jgi:phage shock protein PspC (stress-responsive transcriptional regulator)
MTSTIDPTPSLDQPPTVRRLYRSSTDKLAGGVCGGLAQYSGIDALLWRVGAVAFALTGPGLLVYALLWIALPMEPTGPDYAPNLIDTWAARLRTALTGTRGTPEA